MFRLGLRLTLRSGREALVRLALTTVAVAVGVALLLGVLAEFNAFQAQSNQPCWACTGGNPQVPSPLPAIPSSLFYPGHARSGTGHLRS